MQKYINTQIQKIQKCKNKIHKILKCKNAKMQKYKNAKIQKMQKTHQHFADYLF